MPLPPLLSCCMRQYASEDKAMHHEPEQRKPASAVSDEFQLEAIMKEFGAREPEQPQKAKVEQSTRILPGFTAPTVEMTQSFPAVKPDREKTEQTRPFSPVTQPKREIEQTRSFSVVGSPGDREERTPTPMAPSPAGESEHTRSFAPISEKAPTEADEDDVKVVRSLKDVKTKPPGRPKEPPIRIIVETIPEETDPKNKGEEPTELLRKTHKRLSRLLVRRVFLAADALLGMLLLLYSTRDWGFLPFLNSHGATISLLLLAVAMVPAFPVLWQGVKDLFRLRVSLYTLGTVCTAVCLAYSLSGADTVYAPLVTLQLFFLLQAIVNDNAAHFYTSKSVAAFRSPMGVCNAPQLLENTDSLRRNPGDVEDFMAKLSRSSLPEDLLCVYSSILLLLLPVLSYFLSKEGGLPYLQVWLLMLLGTVPYGAMLSFSKPFRILAKRLLRYGGALCGWHGARIFGGKHTIILRDGDLFPRKGIASNGMKIYHSYDAAKVISYALAALELTDSPLIGLFEELLREHYGKHSRVEDRRFYEQGGVGMEIGSDIVLVGNLGFMRSMGIHMPVGTRVRHAVYVSVNGELAGIFAIRYKANASTRTGLHDVLANRNFSIVLATRDFVITPELIAAKYTLPTDTMVFPDYSERLRLSATNPEQAMEQGALIAEDTFGAYAVTAAAGRTLGSTSLVLVALSLCAGIFGLLFCIVLIAWNSVAVASPMHIAAFQILWAAVTSFAGFVLLRF